MKLKNVADTVVEYARLTHSASYADEVARRHWGATSATHGSMTDASFDDLFAQLHELTGPVEGRSLLDYGAGGGQVGVRFQRAGARVEGLDFVAHFVDEMRALGLEAHLQHVPPGRVYDVVLVNGAFYYAHPSRHAEMLRELAAITSASGSVYITDNPDLRKRRVKGALPAYAPMVNSFYYWLTSVCPVYQPRMAGFFLDFAKLQRQAKAAGFRGTEVIDSWNPMRSHLVLRK